MSTSLLSLASALRSGSLPLTEYLAQLEAHFDAREPEVLAFVPEEGRFERLRREAAALEAQHPDPATRPALFGIPIGIKDIFHVDGFTTRAGTRVPPDLLRGRESEAVAALKHAGALVLGKTVTTEFAYFAPGPTRNPHNPAHTPGGSSSGSAAAVAAGLSPLAFGTQTIGSITRPAAFCGVVGFKPSYERISRAGVIPLSPSLDHVGFFVAQVAGAALVASLLCKDWRSEINDSRAVLGVPEGPYQLRAYPDGTPQYEQTVNRLEAAGFSVQRVPAMPDFDDIYVRHNQIVAAEAAQVHAEWYARHAELYHPKTAELIERGKGVSPAELEEALAGREKLRAELTALMDAHGIDLWISPSAPGVAPVGLESTGDPVMNLPWTYSGLPTLGLPSGRDESGLPYGLQLAARWYADEQLFAWGAQIEAAIV